MLDRLEFDQKTKNDHRKQIEEINLYLNKVLELNDNIRDLPVYKKADEESLKKIINTPIPNKGRNVKEVGDELYKDVFTQAMTIQHPRFFSFVASAVSPYSLFGAIMSDIFNLHGGAYSEAPAACLIEEKLIAWMASLAGFDTTKAGGIFLSGGSISTMSAIIAARENKLQEDDFVKGSIYFSDQTHSSVVKAIRMLGFRKNQYHIIPTDEDFKIRTDLLEEQIKKDINEGFIPFLVVGNLGTTNTGTIDNLDAVGDIAHKYNLWLHVDGAYGGSILVSPIYSKLAKGIEKADSLTWDSHKWLMQTYSCSSLIVKNKQTLLNAFSEHPEYLADISSLDHNDGWDMGPEMSRPHRALKLWCTVQCLGTDLLAELIEYTIENAKIFAREMTKRPNWQLISKPSCGTLNIRYELAEFTKEENDELNSRISQKIVEKAFTFVVTTILKDKKVLRLCLINANTTLEDIYQAIDHIDETAKETAKEMIKGNQ